ncbi:prevent-host-death family protein [Nonomuraea sp. NPDC003804]|uniref:prevent-host-death family protein n=1 Tax=Nonomuraea sp. NPDC003804 TaxID=3154547 RepID=UPI0033AF2DD0
MTERFSGRFPPTEALSHSYQLGPLVSRAVTATASPDSRSDKERAVLICEADFAGYVQLKRERETTAGRGEIEMTVHTSPNYADRGLDDGTHQ